MNNDELVSVVIPTYKRKKELKRSIRSVLSQTYKNFEINVINDCKEDEEVIKLTNAFADSRIRYFRNERTKGANGARNTGIINAKGMYIAFLDDDDEWLPRKLESNLKCLKAAGEDYVGVFSAFKTINKKKWIPVQYENQLNLTSSDFLLNKVKMAAGSNLFVKKAIFNEIGIWDEDLLRQQDLELVSRILNKYKIIHDNTISVKILGQNIPNAFKAFNEREKYVKKIDHLIQELSKADQRLFFSTHYRRQALYLAKLNKRKPALSYWRKGFKNQSVAIKKDLKIAFFLMKSLIV